MSKPSLRVGDEVRHIGDSLVDGIIVAKGKDWDGIDRCCVLLRNRDWFTWFWTEKLEGTGRHFDSLTVDEIAKYMGIVEDATTET